MNTSKYALHGIGNAENQCRKRKEVFIYEKNLAVIIKYFKYDGSI
jgi:hypothetical protein